MRRCLVSVAVAASVFGLVGCGNDTSTADPAPVAEKPTEKPAAPAKTLDDHTPAFVAEWTRKFEASTVPLREREAEYTPGCWTKTQPYLDLADIVDDGTRVASDITATVSGDTAVATFKNADGKTLTDKWVYTKGTWLVDC